MVSTAGLSVPFAVTAILGSNGNSQEQALSLASTCMFLLLPRMAVTACVRSCLHGTLQCLQYFLFCHPLAMLLERPCQLQLCYSGSTSNASLFSHSPLCSAGVCTGSGILTYMKINILWSGTLTQVRELLYLQKGPIHCLSVKIYFCPLIYAEIG